MTVRTLATLAITILMGGNPYLARCQGGEANSRGAEGGSPPSQAVTPDLWSAAATGDLETIKNQLAAGADVNASFVQPGVPGSGATPLHLAVVSGQLEAAGLLIRNGPDIEARAADEYRGTPLHWAAFVGRFDAVKFLIAAGANANAKDANGNTPLFAARDQTIPSEDKPKIVELLQGKQGSARQSDAPVQTTPYRGAYYLNG